jgi:hypothetical protein
VERRRDRAGGDVGEADDGPRRAMAMAVTISRQRRDLFGDEDDERCTRPSY